MAIGSTPDETVRMPAEFGADNCEVVYSECCNHWNPALRGVNGNVYRHGTSFGTSHSYLILLANWFYGDKRSAEGKPFGC